MARTDLTVQTVSVGGLNPATEAANVDGEMFINTGKEFLQVINGSGGSINVTLQTGKTVDGLSVADRVVAVPAGESRLIGPLNTDLYNQPGPTDSGKVYVDFSAVASVTVAVLRLPV